MNKALRAVGKYYIPALMLLPGISLIAFVFFKPIIQTVYLSFFSWNGILQVPKKFIGWNNYIKLFNDKIFWISVRNVLIFLLQGIVIRDLFRLFWLYLFLKNKMYQIFQVYLFFLLSFLSAIAIMWKFILNPNWGLIITLIRLLFFMWIFNPDIAMYSVVLVSVQVYVSLNMIIFSANLTAIPPIFLNQLQQMELLHKKIFYITLPLMMEVKVYIILMIVSSLKHFDLVLLWHAADRIMQLRYRRYLCIFRLFHIVNSVMVQPSRHLF